MTSQNNGIFEQIKNSLFSEKDWREVLEGQGIELPAGKKQGPCPVCGGKDRFSFDNKFNQGNSFCRQCDNQSRDGIALVADYHQVSQLEAAKRIGASLGIQTDYPPNVVKIDFGALVRNGRRKKEASKQALEEKQKLQAGGERAQAVINDYCQPATPEQDYLKRKKIGPNGAYMLNKPYKNSRNKWSIGKVYPVGTLVVPVYGEYGLQSLEFVADDKRGLTGAVKKAGFFAIGDTSAAVIWITEGFADAATIHEQTGQTAVCAFSAGQMPAVAAVIQRLHPDSKVMIAADNDTAGLAAAQKTGLPYSAPEDFKQDWSDVFLNGGDVKTALESNLTHPPKPAEALPEPEARAELSRVAQLVFNRKHPELGQPFSHALIKGAAGLGKTTIIIALARSLPKDRFIEYYCQSIDFAEDVAEKCKAAGVTAKVIRGRDQKIGDVPMCRRAKAAATLGEAGIPVYSSLCKAKDSECPYFKACPYVDQFSDHAQVKIYPTTRFSMPRGIVDALQEIPVCAVVDEAFFQVTTKHSKVTPEKIKQSCISPEAKNILDKWLNTGIKPKFCEILEEAFTRAGETFDKPPISPNSTEADIAKAIAQFKPEGPIYALLKALNFGSMPEFAERYKCAVEVINNEWFSVTGLKPITRFNYKLEKKDWQIPIINLDASADLEVIKASTGMDWELFEINAKRENVHFTHINKSFSKTTLGLLEGQNETAKANAEATINDLISYIEQEAAQAEKVLVATHKDLREIIEDKLPENVDMAHFGNLRGKDRYKDHDLLIQIGAYTPSALSIEILSRQLFNTKTGHKNQLMKLIRESETEQAVDRLRLIGNTKQKRVILMTRHIPASIQPDAVLSWSEAKGKATDSQLVNDIVSRFGGVPMSGRFLSENAPDLVGSEGNARLLLLRKIKPQLVKKVALQNLIRIYIRKCNGENLTNKPVKMAILDNQSPDSINSKLAPFGYEVVPDTTQPEPQTETAPLTVDSGTQFHPESEPPQTVKAETRHTTECGIIQELTTEVLIGSDVVAPPQELTFTGQHITGYLEAQTRVVAELILTDARMTMIHPANDGPVSIMEFLDKAERRWRGRLRQINFATKPEHWPETVYTPLPETERKIAI